MKLFHTADWHLGKIVHGQSMIDDQQVVLEQLIEAVRAEKPDAVIVAGDLYDRSIPPEEAVRLLDEVFVRIVVDLKTPVLAIAGNHDSSYRLHFATGLMQRQGLYLAGELKADIAPVVLTDDRGEVHVYLIPYAEPAHVRHLYGDTSIVTHEQAMQAVVSRIVARMKPGVRAVAVAHAFVTATGEKGDESCDSERTLAVGGAEVIRASVFAPFVYTALGHLHQPHAAGKETIRYAGSILKYSQSEELHQKGFTVVELREARPFVEPESSERVGTSSVSSIACEVAIEKRLFTPKRALRTVTGTLAELLQMERSDDYLFVRLLDSGYVREAMSHIRTVFPNALRLERVSFGSGDPSKAMAHSLLNGEAGIQGAKRRAEMEPVALFAQFYEEMNGRAIEPVELELFERAYYALVREHERGGELVTDVGIDDEGKGGSV